MNYKVGGENPLLSIIIPYYNLSDCLPRCIDSIINQTFSDFEIIIVDDGSCPEESKVCDEIKETDVRIRVIHKKNGGVSSARTEGVEASLGKFITFVDPDDYIEDINTYSSIMYEFLSDSDIDIIQFPFITYNQNKSESAQNIRCPEHSKLLITYEEKINECTAANKWQGDLTTSLCDKVYRREIITNIAFKEMFLEDVVATIDMIAASRKVLLQTKGLYAYCIRENSSITSEWGLKKCCHEAEAIIHTYRFLRDNSSDLNRQNTTYFWIVSMLTNISKQFRCNPVLENLPTIIPPSKIVGSKYNKIRYGLIKCLGLKRYVYTASCIGRLIS